ncbi:hypothetical protein C8J57DRAFT_1052247 [Mycena rebaudengoi]|nr:hypothetical protein C8J57DRAFT_1052247 [Mycena rebaudengoi]
MFQGRNDFSNDNAYIEGPFLLRIVKDCGLQPLHIILIKHVSSAATHLLVIFTDGRYMCDYCMGTNMGIPCQHYFTTWVKIPDLPFHVSLIRARWFQDPGLDVRSTPTVTHNSHTSHSVRFSAINLPGILVSNPLSSNLLLQNQQGPPASPETPGTRTIGQRKVYNALLANMCSMMALIQMEEQLEDLRDRLGQIQ